MFIEVPGATSNIAVAYKTSMCATVGTLRTSSVNKQGECFLLPPLTIMAAFGTDNINAVSEDEVCRQRNWKNSTNDKFEAPYSHSFHNPIGHFQD